MDTEVFNTSVDISNISNHSALHDNRKFLAILNFLIVVNNMYGCMFGIVYHTRTYIRTINNVSYYAMLWSSQCYIRVHQSWVIFLAKNSDYCTYSYWHYA